MVCLFCVVCFRFSVSIDLGFVAICEVASGLFVLMCLFACRWTCRLCIEDLDLFTDPFGTEFFAWLCSSNIVLINFNTGNTFNTGLTGNTFKKRWNKHEGDFRNTTGKHNTRLSTHICKLKEEGKDYETKWEILDRAPTHNPVNMKCRLCLKEIFYIIFRPDSASLNKRNE